MPKREKNQWGGQLVEIIKAIRLLSRPGGASNEELEKELGIGKRSVQRLKKTLNEQLNMQIQEIKPGKRSVKQAKKTGEEPIDTPIKEGGVSPEGHRRWQLAKKATMILPRLDSIGLNTPELLSLYIKERQWAAEQQIEEQEDGSLILIMETAGSYDIKKWVLSYGGDAELLEPQWMREEMIEDMQRGLKRYQGHK